MIKSKASVPHNIIWAKVGAATIVTEALLRMVIGIQCVWKLPKERYPRLHHYNMLAEMQEGLHSHGTHINVLPPSNTT
jgi:hypothetical protein